MKRFRINYNGIGDTQKVCGTAYTLLKYGKGEFEITDWKGRLLLGVNVSDNTCYGLLGFGKDSVWQSYMRKHTEVLDKINEIKSKNKK